MQPTHQIFPSTEKDGSDALPFKIRGITKESTEYEFCTLSENPGSPSLRTIISQYLGLPNSRKVNVKAGQLFLILGRLRCLSFALEKYNVGLASQPVEFLQYWRCHTVNLLSSFGVRPSSDPVPLQITGLKDLISHMESLFVQEISQATESLETGLVTFEALGELFRPEIPVKAMTGLGNNPPVLRVTDSYYEERKNIHGTKKHFHVNFEFVVLVGDHFSIAAFSEVVPAWGGARSQKLGEFAYQPIPMDEQKSFEARGERCAQFGTGGEKYLAYLPHSFYMHSSRARRDASAMAQAANSSLSLTGGRIMVDMARGASLGHYPCQGVDEASLAIIALAHRYRQWFAKGSPSNETDTGFLTVWDTVPSELNIYCWPALVGFSFTAKAWGHVLIDGLSQIEFSDNAFDRLVLSQERKQLLHAVVRHGTAPHIQDLITSKQGGLIFLLHGPPGVGKTLTAEAVAEELHRPLYYVTMGELGLTPDDLESRLSDVLDLCAKWNAIAVLDEADVFLETRSNSDLIRNAMVCVMLRTLEYHPGILFLTTNRVRTLDPAFESRITIAMRYESLDADARMKVWQNQLDGVSVAVASDVSCKELAEQPLNGRQIKNAVRLALCLAADQQSPLSQRILLKTLEITTFARQNMHEDNAWQDSLK
ncbi:hypothetical protein FE257_001619 [Aspergillus nanangensis]|uniref:AAA+ ATPase domain-containing protein n=1 Tax=Aspergillus nanangensis TaxID=2582783 RepID=A0AAD4GXA8_ASPNN|nr:hypothetical protein FE257_001619 [Aspergillus nanangensis]